MKKCKFSVVVPVNSEYFNENIIERISEVYTSCNIIVSIMGPDVSNVSKLINDNKIIIIKTKSKTFNYSFCVNVALKRMVEEYEFSKDEIVAISDAFIVFSMVQLSKSFKDFDFNKKYFLVDIIEDNLESPLSFDTKRLMLSVKHQVNRLKDFSETIFQIPISTIDIILNKINGLEEKLFTNLSLKELVMQLNSFGLEEVKPDLVGLELEKYEYKQEEIDKEIDTLNTLYENRLNLDFIENNHGDIPGDLHKLKDLFINNKLESEWKPKKDITYVKVEDVNKEYKIIPVTDEEREKYKEEIIVREYERKGINQTSGVNTIDFNRKNLVKKESIVQRKRKRRQYIQKLQMNNEEIQDTFVEKPNNIISDENLGKNILLMINNDLPSISSASVVINALKERNHNVFILINTKKLEYYKLIENNMISGMFDIGDVMQCKINLSDYDNIIRFRDCKINLPVKYEKYVYKCTGPNVISANTSFLLKEDEKLFPYCMFKKGTKIVPSSTIGICTSYDLHNRPMTIDFIKEYENLIKILSLKNLHVLLINLRYEKTFINNSHFSIMKNVYVESDLDILNGFGLLKQCSNIIVPTKSNCKWMSFLLGKSTYIFKENNDTVDFSKVQDNIKTYSLKSTFDAKGFMEMLCTKI